MLYFPTSQGSLNIKGYRVFNKISKVDFQIKSNVIIIMLIYTLVIYSGSRIIFRLIVSLI